MRIGSKSLWIVIGVVCILGGSVLTIISLERVSAQLNHLIAIPFEEVIVGTMQSTWTSGGTSHTFTTNRMDGESDADHAARHAAGLAAMQDKFPPD